MMPKEYSNNTDTDPDIDHLLTRVNKLVGSKQAYEKSIVSKEKQLDECNERVAVAQEAKNFLMEAIMFTQENFRKKVESLVTMAVRSIFPERDFEFVLDSVLKKNRYEYIPKIREDGRLYLPKDEKGGSMIDTLSLALRPIMWSLQNPRSRNLLVLDEPLKWMGRRTDMGGRILKELAGRLGFQLIIITHSTDLMEIADRTFVVTHDGKKSLVKQLDQPEPVVQPVKKRVKK